MKFATAHVLISIPAWLCLCACVPSPKPDAASRYVIAAIESEPTNLDPRYSTDANSARISALIFNSLMRTDEYSRIQPDLAESWEAIDQLTYIFHLRKGITFHNGSPLTAEDVKFTYDSVLDAKNRSPKRGSLRALKAVQVLGPYRLRFRLSAPHAPFLDAMTLGIVPAGTSVEPGRAKNTLVGSGPFALEEHLPGEQIILKADPSYWEGAPSVSGLIIKIIPDAMVRVLEFKKGTLDFLQNDLEPDMLPWLEKHSDARILIRQGTTFEYLGINFEHPILKHRAVRQAIAHAIDRRAIIRHLLKETAVPATGLLSPSHWAYEPAAPHIAYNPEHAKILLDKAGFPDPDGDGPLPRFKLSYKTTTLDLRRRIAEAFKDQLDRIGIALEIRTFEWGTFYSDIKKGNFHLYSLSWVGISDPDLYYTLFHSTSFPPHGDNRSRYKNPRLDRLLEQGRISLNLQERKRIYSKVQSTLAADLPYVPLWWLKNVVVLKPNIRGFTPYPDGNLISLRNISLHSPPFPE